MNRSDAIQQFHDAATPQAVPQGIRATQAYTLSGVANDRYQQWVSPLGIVSLTTSAKVTGESFTITAMVSVVPRFGGRTADIYSDPAEARREVERGLRILSGEEQL
jgi:hypothetical protein